MTKQGVHKLHISCLGYFGKSFRRRETVTTHPRSERDGLMRKKLPRHDDRPRYVGNNDDDSLAPRLTLQI